MALMLASTIEQLAQTWCHANLLDKLVSLAKDQGCLQGQDNHIHSIAMGYLTGAG